MTSGITGIAIAWETTKLDEYIAEEFFGWRWLTHLGIPTRSAPDYPTKRPVRAFFPPDGDLPKQWFKYFAEVPHTPSNGDEPLDYSYCSSQGGFMVPHFSGHLDEFQRVEMELDKRGLLSYYDELLTNQTGGKARFASCENRCLAALATIGSKYVTKVPA